MSEINGRWRTARLDEICDVILGQSPPGNTYNTDERGLPFYQGKAEFGDLYPVVRKWCSAPAKIAEAEDVLLSVRAPVGPTNLCPEKSCIGRGLAAIRPRDGMPARYILYAIRATVASLALKGTGSTFEAVSGSDVRAHQIPVAPSDEQLTIVARIEEQFSRLDAGVAALKRVQANLKRYRASVLKAACEGRLVPTEAELARQEGRTYESGTQLLERILAERRAKWNGRGKYKEPDGCLNSDFADYGISQIASRTAESGDLPEGWAWATAEQLSDATRAITYGVIKLGQEVDGGVPVLRTSDVRPLRLDLSDVKRISPKTASEFRRTFLQGNEVLVAVRGTLGGVVVAPPECAGFNISREVAMLALVRPETARAVAVFIGSNPLQRWLMQRTKGIAYTGINIETLKQLPIPVPPLGEQERIVGEVERRLSVVEEVEAAVAANLQRAGRLRLAVLQRAFGPETPIGAN